MTFKKDVSLKELKENLERKNKVHKSELVSLMFKMAETLVEIENKLKESDE